VNLSLENSDETPFYFLPCPACRCTVCCGRIQNGPKPLVRFTLFLLHQLHLR
jgi:hypothetical protein